MVVKTEDGFNMAGTLEGGRKAAEKNKKLYGEDFYKKMAIKANESWVKNGKKPRGFAANKKAASMAGKKSKRTKK